jgi:hypothetical protein
VRDSRRIATRERPVSVFGVDVRVGALPMPSGLELGGALVPTSNSKLTIPRGAGPNAAPRAFPGSESLLRSPGRSDRSSAGRGHVASPSRCRPPISPWARAAHPGCAAGPRGSRALPESHPSRPSVHSGVCKRPYPAIIRTWCGRVSCWPTVAWARRDSRRPNGSRSIPTKPWSTARVTDRRPPW